MPRLLLLLIVTLAAGALLAEALPSRPAQAESIVQGLGDVDCNGSVDAIDAILVLQYTAELLDALRCPEKADVRPDQEINSRDATLILQYSAGLVHYFAGEVDPATILAFDIETGAELWQVELPIASPSTPVIDGNSLLVQGGKDCNSTRGVVMALDKTSAEERWRMPVDNGNLCADMTFSSFGGIAVIQNSGKAMGIAVDDGSTIWEHTLEPANDNSDGDVVPIDSSEVVLVREGAVYRALSRSTGEELWAVNAGPYEGEIDANSTALFLANWRTPIDVLSAASAAGASLVPCGLTALELTNGQVRWNAPEVLSGCLSGLDATDQLAVTCSSENVINGERLPATVYALANATGAEHWHRAMSCYGVSVDATNVYVQPANQPPGPALTALDPSTGYERWHFDGHKMATRGFLTDNAHVVTFPGYPERSLIVLDAATGNPLWKRELPGQGSPFAHATISDGVLYVAATGRPIPRGD